MRWVCFKRIIVCAILIALLVDGQSGLPNNSSGSSTCSNFTFSSTERTYLPSEIINLTSSCSMTTECPSWNITSQPAEIKILRNDTKVIGQTCTLNMSIQVVNFGENVTRIQLLVDFDNPRNERTRVINVEKRGDGGRCYIDQDCYNTDQACSGVPGYERCSCPHGFVFVPNLRRCHPVIWRLYGQCTYGEQCRAHNSICKDSACQCPAHHFSDEYFFNCLPDARSYAEECATDQNCQKRDINTWCIQGHCACKSNYFNDRAGCYSAGSSVFSRGWVGILATVFLMISRA